MIKLGVNIDHVATVRQARRTVEPDPVWAAALAELAGADGITAHLREDRRHMQDRDLRLLRETVRTRLNLEMAAAEEIVAFALALRPDQATLVPERREEVTTEGGLDVAGGQARLAEVTGRLQEAGVVVSLFVDPVPAQIEASAAAGASFIELHAGAYAEAWGDEAATARALDALAAAARQAHQAGLRINAGHGLTYQNVGPICALPHLEELNIGHAIISRAVFAGLDAAVREMKALLGG
jgi:pyridoxine 5-phosphate synthase